MSAGSSDEKSTSLSRLLASTAKQMRADLERSSEVRHHGEKGSIRERMVVAGLLRDYLPGNIRVAASCEIADVEGGRSPQIDIAIYDPIAPPLYRERYGDFQILPSECVYGTIEVKTRLDGCELKKTIKQAKAVKRLQKSEYYFNESTLRRPQYGTEWSYCPTVSFVFAYDSIDLQTLAMTMAHEYAAERTPPHERIDAIWVLGKGALLWCASDTNTEIHPSPCPNDRIGIAYAHKGQDILLNMITMLTIHFASCWMPPFDFRGYAGDAPQATLSAFVELLDPDA